MNSLYIIFCTLLLFAVSYKFYGRLLEGCFGVDSRRPTPAHTKYDGVDYVPAKHWTVLFGHHFSSIAGAGPILGPIIATAIWGWGPALGWVILGTIFIGGVHDFGSLITSVRQGGLSIGDIAKDVISHRAKILFSSFVLLALILVIAIFTYFCAQTFVSEPRIVLPSLGLIPVAFLIGLSLYRLNMNLVFTTLSGLCLLTSLILLGNKLPIELGDNSFVIWCSILLLYCFIASITPVQYLLQPRDYLSSFLLLFGVLFGFAGLILTHPTINTSFYIGWSSTHSGMLWPMLFVTVACGAMSGFHCLVASGTTSKQLSSEIDAKKIGYGGMLAEGVVGVLAVLCVSAGIKHGSVLSSFLTGSGAGPIGAYAQGYGEITKSILLGYGGFIAIMVLNGFILTSLDTATRISRYLTQELFGIRNRYLATGGVVVVSGLLLFSGSGSRIWQTFGAANQLVGAIALIILTSWLLSNDKRIIYTLPPAIFMCLTTIIALFYQISQYLRTKDYVLLTISICLEILAIYMIIEAIRFVRNKQGGQFNSPKIWWKLCCKP